MMAEQLGIEALTFDVFGTMVDWHSAILRDGAALSQRHGLTVDWSDFAEQWRAGYRPQMDRVRRGELPWTRLDELHRETLDRLLPLFGLQRLSEEEKGWLNGVWHRLPAWPDVAAGLARLRTRYVAATLSNGDVSMLVDISRFAGLTWDCVLSAELARHFKPDCEAYLTAARLLHLPPARVLMVAAHYDDLAGLGRRGCGQRTWRGRRSMLRTFRRRRNLILLLILRRGI